MRSAPPMLETAGLGKRFGSRTALEDLTLRVERGEIFGLLGHNGAGKSTSIGILLGLVAPTAGRAWIGGHCVLSQRAAALHRVGAIFETPAFYDYLSGVQNLRFLVSLSGQPLDERRLREVAGLVGLEGRMDEPVRNFSHGMRQRLALAGALLPAPDFLILDEPTDGLDPLGIQEMRAMVRRLREEFAITVLLSSHLLSEVEQLCDRVAILHNGKMVFCGRWEQGSPRWRIDAEPVPGAAAVCAQNGWAWSDGVLELGENGDIADVVARLVGAGLRVRAVEPLRRTLEDFYLETCRQADGAEAGNG